MRWYFHAVERLDGGWSCQHGRTIADSHPSLPPTLEHLRELANEVGNDAEFFVHHLNGDVEPV
jgi:hypothetical protein